MRDVRFVFGTGGEYIKSSFERLNYISVFQAIDPPSESSFFQLRLKVAIELIEFFACK
jgi:hypothetical protein